MLARLRGLAANAGRVAGRVPRRTAVLTLATWAAVAALVLGFGVLSGITGAGGPDESRPGQQHGALVGGTGREDRGTSATPHPDPTGGLGVHRPGIHLRAVPDGFGDVEVVETVHANRPVRNVILSAPRPAPDADGRSPRLVDLQVSADDGPVPTTGTVEGGQAVPLTLPQPATRLVLRYRLLDADARNPSSIPGRATLSLRPATWRSFGTLPAVVSVQGVTVRNLVCLDVPQEERLCGIERGREWRTVPVPTSRSTALALVDLPVGS